MAAGVLEQTKQAHSAVATHDRDESLNHVRKAMSLALDIQQTSLGTGAPTGSGLS
jgi:hypothetical protein